MSLDSVVKKNYTMLMNMPGARDVTKGIINGKHCLVLFVSNEKDPRLLQEISKMTPLMEGFEVVIRERSTPPGASTENQKEQEGEGFRWMDTGIVFKNSINGLNVVQSIPDCGLMSVISSLTLEDPSRFLKIYKFDNSKDPLEIVIFLEGKEGMLDSRTISLEKEVFAKVHVPKDGPSTMEQRYAHSIIGETDIIGRSMDSEMWPGLIEKAVVKALSGQVMADHFQSTDYSNIYNMMPGRSFKILTGTTVTDIEWGEENKLIPTMKEYCWTENGSTVRGERDIFLTKYPAVAETKINNPGVFNNQGAAEKGLRYNHVYSMIGLAGDGMVVVRDQSLDVGTLKNVMEGTYTLISGKGTAQVNLTKQNRVFKISPADFHKYYWNLLMLIP